MIATPRNPPPTAALLLLEAIDLPRPTSRKRGWVGGGFLLLGGAVAILLLSVVHL